MNHERLLVLGETTSARGIALPHPEVGFFPSLKAGMPNSGAQIASPFFEEAILPLMLFV